MAQQDNLKQAEGQEGRRVDRSERERLLFAPTQLIARQQGTMVNGVNVAINTSRIGRNSYALKTAEGHLIARVPLAEAREMLAYLRTVARQLFANMKVVIMKENTAAVERRQVRRLNEVVRGLALVIGEGQRFSFPGSENARPDHAGQTRPPQCFFALYHL
jgi:hypothetical protein